MVRGIAFIGSSKNTYFLDDILTADDLKPLGFFPAGVVVISITTDMFVFSFSTSTELSLSTRTVLPVLVR
jgi:hypothetical protein